MRIIQITDLHIGGPEEFPFQVDVRSNFLRILDEVEKYEHDLLVISGDLCYQDGEVPIYEWIRSELEKRQLKYVVIPGNHDDAQMMVETFELPCELRQNFFFNLPEPAPPVVFLNSGPGVLDSLQLEALQAYLKQTQQSICLFIHHPPLPMGVPYMDDNHAMRATEDLIAVLTTHPYPISIFTGHYHVEKSLRWKNLDIHITPSCFFQIDWKEQDFAVDHHRCALRWIEWDGTQLQHGLRYIEGVQQTQVS